LLESLQDAGTRASSECEGKERIDWSAIKMQESEAERRHKHGRATHKEGTGKARGRHREGTGKAQVGIRAAVGVGARATGGPTCINYKTISELI
jgi:hypothetical protein